MSTSLAPESAAEPPATISRAGWRAILALGVTQIIGYGTTYYLLAVLSPLIARELSMPKSLLLAGVSLTFLAGAALGPFSGRLQDRIGSKRLMAMGSIIASIGLALLSQATGVVTYFIAWAIIGLAAPFSLYNSAFTALSRICGRAAPRAIVLLTLIAGLASTIMWPLAAWLITFMDWRSVVLLYAAMNLFIALPLNGLFLDGAETKRESAATDRIVASLAKEGRPRAFTLFAGMLTAVASFNNAWSMLAFPLLFGLGFDLKTAVIVASSVGVFQTLGRFGTMISGDRISPLQISLLTNAFYAVCFFLLAVASGSLMIGLLFALAYGIANGLNTIIKGTLTLQLFGSSGYGEKLGKLSVAPSIAAAIGPIIGGLLLDSYGVGGLLVGFILMSLAALILMMMLITHCRAYNVR